MAAEASADAQFPVYLALAKLALEFSYEWFLKVKKLSLTFVLKQTIYLIIQRKYYIHKPAHQTCLRAFSHQCSV